jgi:hypothetical protein
MSAGATGAWERHADGGYISVPISWRDLDRARAWCAENCEGDYIVDLGRRIVFERHEDAALAALWWRAEED